MSMRGDSPTAQAVQRLSMEARILRLREFLLDFPQHPDACRIKKDIGEIEVRLGSRINDPILFGKTHPYIGSIRYYNDLNLLSYYVEFVADI